MIADQRHKSIRYISQSLITDRAKPDGIRLSAPEVESAIAKAITSMLADAKQVEESLGAFAISPSELQHLIVAARDFGQAIARKSPADQNHMLRPAIANIIIGANELAIAMRPRELRALFVKAEGQQLPNEMRVPEHTIRLPLRLGKRGSETRLIIQSGSQRQIDKTLVGLVAKGYVWREELASGRVQSAQQMADSEGVTKSYVSRVMDLGFLAPDITAAFLSGTAPPELTYTKMRKLRDIPLDWRSQRAVLGF